MLLSRTGSLQYAIVSILVFAALIAILIVGLLAWRRRRSGTPSTLGAAASPYRFIRLCTKNLNRDGWNVDHRLWSYFHLFAERKGLTAHIACRAGGFEVDDAFLRDIHSWRVRYNLECAIAITHGSPTQEQCSYAAGCGVLLLHYTEVDSLVSKLQCLRASIAAKQARRGIGVPAHNASEKTLQSREVIAK
jgi:hypothetical protein